MLQRRACRVLEFLAFLVWLNLLLDFFGLRTPLIATTEAALNANLAVGSFNITLGGILAFLITVWASFLVSKFLRFGTVWPIRPPSREFQIDGKSS
jgi:potassium-dependent mechanosensitive channel